MDAPPLPDAIAATHPAGPRLARLAAGRIAPCRGIAAAPVRSYCWARRSGRAEGWTVDSRVPWCAALFHDIGLTSIASNTMLRGGGRRARSPDPGAVRDGGGGRGSIGDRDHPAHAAGVTSTTASRRCCSTAGRRSTSEASMSLPRRARPRHGHTQVPRAGRSIATSFGRTLAATTVRAPSSCTRPTSPDGWRARRGGRHRYEDLSGAWRGLHRARAQGSARSRTKAARRSPCSPGRSPHPMGSTGRISFSRVARGSRRPARPARPPAG